MPKSVNFIKRVAPRNRPYTFDIEKLSKRYKSQPLLKTINIRIERKDILHFKYICIFEKKVIVTYNNYLKMFGYFDLHAVHQRIRYQYYCRAIKIQSGYISLQKFKPLNQPFDERCIEKNGKQIQKVYGQSKNLLIDVTQLNAKSLMKDFKKIIVWGVTLQCNNSGQVCITSYKPILRQTLQPQDLLEVIQDIVTNGTNRIPKRIDAAIAQASCKNAYKFNDDLDNQTAKMMIMNLSICQFPWHCVHGRTTIHIKEFPFIK